MSDTFNQLFAILQGQIKAAENIDATISQLTFESLMENLSVIVEHQTNRSSFSCHEHVVGVVQSLQPAQLKELLTELEGLHDQNAANIFVKCLASDIVGYSAPNINSPCKAVWAEVFSPKSAGKAPLVRLQEALLTVDELLAKRLLKWERLLENECALAKAGMAAQLAQLPRVGSR